MFKVKEFEKDDINSVIAFERELRKQEPDTYYWEPDATYRKLLEGLIKYGVRSQDSVTGFSGNV